MHRWRGWCVVCGATLSRHWWQRGPLTPVPICHRSRAGACLTRSLHRR